MWLLRQLAGCFTYLSIRVGTGIYTSKIFADVIAPIIGGAGLTILYYQILGQPDFFNEDQFAAKFANLFEILAAFFIAALAAVASFDRPSLDQPLAGEPAVMSRWCNKSQAYRDIALTRRMFIGYLFAYLSTVSLCVALCMPFFEAFADANKSSSSLEYQSACLVGHILFFCLLTNIVITSLYGIFFLSHRIHDPDQN